MWNQGGLEFGGSSGIQVGVDLGFKELKLLKIGAVWT